MADKTIKSVRANQEVFDRIAEISKGTGLDQGATLEALLNAYDVQQAKGQVPERAADIADFDAHVQGIQSAFLRSLELASSAEMRARAEFRALLDARDATIAALQRELEDARADLKLAADKITSYEEQAGRLTARLDELTKRDRLADLLDQMQARLDDQQPAAQPKTSRRSRKAPQADGDAVDQ